MPWRKALRSKRKRLQRFVEDTRPRDNLSPHKTWAILIYLGFSGELNPHREGRATSLQGTFRAINDLDKLILLVNAHLSVNALAVPLDRSGCNAELFRYTLKGVALSDKRGGLPLALRQTVLSGNSFPSPIMYLACARL